MNDAALVYISDYVRYFPKCMWMPLGRDADSEGEEGGSERTGRVWS
jgi:hypothetical protein